MPEDAAVPTEFPHELGKTARRELALHGYTRFEQLTHSTPKQLLAIHGVGPEAVRILSVHLAERGLAFATSSDANRPPEADAPEGR